MPIDVRVAHESGWRPYIARSSSPSEPIFVLGETEPTPSNTGPRVAPTQTVFGNVTLTTGQTYSGKILKGRISVPISATGTIIIEDNIIDASETTPLSGNIINVHANTGATVIIRHNEIIGTSGTLGIAVRRFTAYRNYIHHVEDGIRIHNFNGTGVAAANAVVEGNLIGPLIILTPDPYINRIDNRTHSDCIQIEGCDGIVIRGNALNAYHTGLPTSNQEWAMNAHPYESVPTGTANARAHPQASHAIMISPNVSQVTNLTIDRNWCRAGEMGINTSSLVNASTTGAITGNRFNRDQWHATYTINIKAAAVDLTTSGNVYEDNNAPVTVRRQG